MRELFACGISSLSKAFRDARPDWALKWLAKPQQLEMQRHLPQDLS